MSPTRVGTFTARRFALAAVGLSFACCVTTPARPEIAAGELLVRTTDPTVLTTEALCRLAGRDDFRVQAAECVEKTCRVVVTRVDGSAADTAFTWTLVEALSAGLAASPGAVESVKPNSIQTLK